MTPKIQLVTSRFSVSFSAADQGRSSVWVHCAIPLRLEFDSAEPIRLDPAYVNELAQAAASAMGIVIDLDEAAAAAGTPALAVAA